MKVVFYTETERDGKVQDWPVVPRVGELVHYHHVGGLDIMAVKAIYYYANSDGSFRDIGVELVFPEADTYMLHGL